MKIWTKTGQPLAVERLLNGRFDVWLAALLAVLAIIAGWIRHDPVGMIVELVACGCAALTAYWPRVGGLGLCLVLLALTFLRPALGYVGEYAALIPILSTGMRGHRSLRAWMTAVYGLLIVTITYQKSPGGSAMIFEIVMWLSQFAVLWGIGNLFAAYCTAQKERQEMALQQYRLSMAHELHDTVARHLSRASLQAQMALDSCPSPAIEAVVADIGQASRQLRELLVFLRDPHSSSPPAHQKASEVLTGVTDGLKLRGFTVTITIDGDLDEAAVAVAPTFRAVIGELGANVERHADPEQPCTIIASADDCLVETIFLNGIPSGRASDSFGIGLLGVQERLELVGGQLKTHQKGSQWMSHVTIPVWRRPPPS